MTTRPTQTHLRKYLDEQLIDQTQHLSRLTAALQDVVTALAAGEEMSADQLNHANDLSGRIDCAAYSVLLTLRCMRVN